MDIKEIQTSLGLGRPEDNEKYVDFSEYFKVKSWDFSQVPVSDDIEPLLISIYKKLNGETFPFCKNARIREIDRRALYNYLKKKKYAIVSTLFQGNCYVKKDSVIVLAAPDNKFIVALDEAGDEANVKFLYNQDDKGHLVEIDKILSLTKDKGEGGRVSLLLKEYGEMLLSEFQIKQVKFDPDNYNDDFIPVKNKIVSFLNSEEGGIVLLASAPGAGKTFFLRSLVNEIENKKIVYISRDAVSAISSPDFLSFAIRELKNSILYLEDANEVLNSEGGRSDATINIINLSDGILNDILLCKIVITSNARPKEIDAALKRRGRLKVRHEFQKLTVEKSNNLLKKLGKSYVTKEPMNLCDIYNTEDNNGETGENKVGF